MHSGTGNKGIPEANSAELLHRLASADAGPAWVEFLDRYSNLIQAVANRFEYRQGRSADCFLFVCEQLSDDGFRRLLCFNTSSDIRFRTWLGTVVFNLCVDWHRREFGRAMLLPAISALPAFDQAVYRLLVEQDLDKEAAYQTLRSDYPDLTRDMVRKAALRVFSVLTPRQRWQLTVRYYRKRSGAGGAAAGIDALPDPVTNPEDELEKQQQIETLRSAMDRLPAQQRLLLQLRFQEGLSLRKIAEVLQLGDTNRAWRKIQAAVKAINLAVNEKKSTEQRKM